MSKISIVGVEGSGKTVMMAAFGDKYKHPDSSGLFLSPENPTAFSFVEVQMEQMHQGKWPNATVTDSLKSLNWSLFLKRDGKNQKICDISFLDFAGEIYRLAFGDHSESEKSGLENEIAALKKHIIESDMLIVLINLSEIINGSVSNARTRETMWLSKGILDFAQRETNISNIAIVFSQADVYNTIISTYGGVQKTYEHFLPHCANVYPDIPIISVSAINKTTPDENGLAVPDQGFESEGLDDLMKLIIGNFPNYLFLLDEIEEKIKKNEQLKKQVIEAQIQYINSLQQKTPSASRYHLATSFLQIVQEAASVFSTKQYNKYLLNAHKAADFEKSVFCLLENIEIFKKNPNDDIYQCPIEKSVLDLANLFKEYPEFEVIKEVVQTEISQKEHYLEKKAFEQMISEAINIVNSDGADKAFHKVDQAIEMYPDFLLEGNKAKETIVEKYKNIQERAFENSFRQILDLVKIDDHNAALAELDGLLKQYPILSKKRGEYVTKILQQQISIKTGKETAKKKQTIAFFMSIIFTVVLIFAGYIFVKKHQSNTYKQELLHKEFLGYTILHKDGKDYGVWRANKMHKNIEGITTSEKELYWKLSPGFRWQNNSTDLGERYQNLQTQWVKNLPHPTISNVASGSIVSQWVPRIGYDWLDNTHSKVIWKVGKPHPEIKGIKTSPTEEEWILTAGFRWKDDNSDLNPRKNRLQTQWVKGVPHPIIKNVFSGEHAENWVPAMGYVWNSEEKSSVKWSTGIKHPLYNAVTSSTEGSWTLQENYRWKQAPHHEQMRTQNLETEFDVDGVVAQYKEQTKKALSNAAYREALQFCEKGLKYRNNDTELTALKIRITSTSFENFEQKFKKDNSSNDYISLLLPWGVKLEMRKIYSGKFVMGSSSFEREKFDCKDWAEPRHNVTISQNFYLGICEVTQAQYEAIMGKNPAKGKIGENYPVNAVSWLDAMEFCKKMNEKYSKDLPIGYEFSLPTEAQWEYACRAGTTTPYWFGDSWNSQYEVTASEMREVKSTGYSNPWGLFDMHSNLSEWCRDAKYDELSDATDPFYASGDYKVYRGGSFYFRKQDARSAFRNCVRKDKSFTTSKGDKEETPIYAIGFRLALAPIARAEEQ